MLEDLKLYLNVGEPDVRLLELLIRQCKDWAINYCNLESYDKELDFIVFQMVCERYSRVGAEGIDSRSFSGVSEQYYSNFSDAVIKSLNRYRRIGVIKNA